MKTYTFIVVVIILALFAAIWQYNDRMRRESVTVTTNVVVTEIREEVVITSTVHLAANIDITTNETDIDPLIVRDTGATINMVPMSVLPPTNFPTEGQIREQIRAVREQVQTNQ